MSSFPYLHMNGRVFSLWTLWPWNHGLCELVDVTRVEYVRRQGFFKFIFVINQFGQFGSWILRLGRWDICVYGCFCGSGNSMRSWAVGRHMGRSVCCWVIGLCLTLTQLAVLVRMLCDGVSRNLLLSEKPTQLQSWQQQQSQPPFLYRTNRS